MDEQNPEINTGTQPEVVEETIETPVPPQDPIEVELEKVNRKEARTEAEKAAYSLKKNAERVKELGLDPSSILGISPEMPTDEDTPVTVGMLKQMEKDRAARSAESLADEQVNDPRELQLVKHYLTNTIKPSGNPAEDLRAARLIVNSVKNSQIAEETNRRTVAKSHSSGGGAPPRSTETFVPTPEEATLMKAWGLTQEEVIKSRQPVK